MLTCFAFAFATMDKASPRKCSRKAEDQGIGDCEDSANARIELELNWSFGVRLEPELKFSSRFPPPSPRHIGGDETTNLSVTPGIRHTHCHWDSKRG